MRSPLVVRYPPRSPRIDDRRLAFGDHPLGARLALDDERVVGGLDAVVEAPVFLQQTVQLRFGRRSSPV